MGLMTLILSVGANAHTTTSFHIHQVNPQKSPFVKKKPFSFLKAQKRATKQRLFSKKIGVFPNRFLMARLVRKSFIRRSLIERMASRKNTSYFSKLNIQTRRNARLIGLDRLYTHDLYGNGNSVAVVEFSGGWGALRRAIKEKSTPLDPEVRRRYNQNFQSAIGGPHLHPEKTNSWVEHQVQGDLTHASDVSSVILDLSPKAKVIPVSTYNSIGNGGQYDLGDALFDLAMRNDIGVINVSSGDLERYSNYQIRGQNPDGSDRYLYNYTFPTKYLSAVQAIAREGKVIVFAAGNDGTEVMDETVLHPYAKESKIYFLRFINFLVKNLDPETLKYIIFAGNIDAETKDIAPSSSRPGTREEIQDRFLCAPGFYHYEYNNVRRKGTSNSAAVISSVLACLMSKRGVTGKKAVEALLQTADQRPRERRTYGRGTIRGDLALKWLETHQ